jgi:hypothetical protein
VWSRTAKRHREAQVYRNETDRFAPENSSPPFQGLAMIATDNALRQPTAETRTGPSFAAALFGFLGSTVATTMVMFLLSSSV